MAREENVMNLIRKARQEKGMSQEKLASLVGVATQTIHRWESGKRSPRAEELAALASALNTTVAYLSGETDEPEPPAPMGNNLKISNSSPAPGGQTAHETRQETITATGRLIYKWGKDHCLDLPDTPENRALLADVLIKAMAGEKPE